ncbi:hypothetical protein [Shouchella shacheensis]|uniref:hypothetical protein n=1 Tax=Shouchella shacheensis TaxID=1649580 RepID=UPI00073FD0C3|nr:hypothetical protein [Shouchella shacheensis]
MRTQTKWILAFFLAFVGFLLVCGLYIHERQKIITTDELLSAASTADREDVHSYFSRELQAQLREEEFRDFKHFLQAELDQTTPTLTLQGEERTFVIEFRHRGDRTIEIVSVKIVPVEQRNLTP